MVAPRRRRFDKRDRLKQLRTFYYAAHLVSITRAAETLGITHAAVSTRVRALEEELGAKLFDRSHRRVSRTAAGETLYRLVAPLMRGIDDLLLNLSEQLKEAPSGEIRIGASHCVATSMLPAHLKRFSDLYPGIRTHIRRCATEEGARLLAADEVELLFGPQGFIRTSEARDKLVYRPLYPYRFVLATPLDHPLAGRESVTQKEVAAYPVIVRHAGMFSTRFGESPVQTPCLESNVVLEFGACNIVKRHVEAGLGIAVLPSVCITSEDRLAIIPLTQHFKSRTGGLFARNDRSLSSAAERFVELLERQFAGCIPRTSANAAGAGRPGGD